MPFIRLCQTRAVTHEEIEHNLFIHPKQTWTWTKDQLHVTHPGSTFTGSRKINGVPKQRELPYFLKQKRSPLFSSKTYEEISDNIHPTDELIKNLHTGQCQINIEQISSSKHLKLFKKFSSPHFLLNKKLDQIESRYWLHSSPIKIIGWCLRRFRNPNNNSKENEKFISQLYKVKIKSTHPLPTFSQQFNKAQHAEFYWTKSNSTLLLNSKELAYLLSLPSPDVIKTMQSETCAWIPGNLEIKPSDRLKHLHILGKTGMGKSTAILKLFESDLKQFKQVILMDPHGDLIEDAIKRIPAHRHKDIVLLDPSHRTHPIAINPLECIDPLNIERQASSLLDMFFALSKGSWGPRLEYLLRNSLLTLLLCPNTTLLDIPLLLTNNKSTQNYALQCNDNELERFWLDEFLTQDQRQQKEMIAPVLNKVGPLITSPLLRNIFGQTKSKFSFDQILTKPAIILIPLSKPKLGEDASRLLGMSMISMLHGSLLKRKERIPISLTLDEFQNFATPTLMTMLSESRKFGLGLSLAHQYLKQADEQIINSILGNVGSHLLLRTSYEDAQKLAPIMGLEPNDLINLPELNAYFKTLKDGQPQPSTRIELKFNSTSSPPPIIKQQFGRPKAFVEAKLKARYNRRKNYSRQ